jgi:hypothetical protein
MGDDTGSVAEKAPVADGDEEIEDVDAIGIETRVLPPRLEEQPLLRAIPQLP